MKKKWFAIVAVVLVLLLVVIPSVVTVCLHRYHFGGRVTHENNYFQFLSQNNPAFNRNIVTFTSDDGQLLEGGFHYQEGLEDPQALLVWVHGKGVNYENYLAEIEWLTRAGYLVFSYNNTGVDTSEGDSVKGLTQAPLDLQSALTYLYELDRFNDIPNILIGHSWGGFAVSSVSALDIPREVDGIISLAGFWRNINVIEDIGKYYVGNVVSALVPYLSVYESFLFGEYADLNGVQGLLSTEAPVLIIHSKDDIIVRHDNNFMYYQSVFEGDDRFTFKEYEDAGHKLTITNDAYNRIHDIMHHQMKMESTDQHYIELEEERLSLISDFNDEVMNDILEFCENIVSAY